MVRTGRTLLSISFSSNFLAPSLFSSTARYPFCRTSLLSSSSSSLSSRVFIGFKPLCSSTTTTVKPEHGLEPMKHSILLDRLRIRHLKDSAKTQQVREPAPARNLDKEGKDCKKSKQRKSFSSFEELGLSEEVLGAVNEIGISVPTEIQGLGIPAVLERKSVVLGSHTGSGKTLAYLLPLVQLLRQDEALHGMIMKPRRPRAVVLCPTRELSEQVFRVAKSISHHARFRSTMVSGGGRLRPQEDSLNAPIDMVVGTPGRILQHIEEGNMVYGDINYVVLDEADTMFDRGFGPDIRKFLGPLKNRALKSDDQGFQTVLVSATMTKAVQKLVDEEFQGIVYLRTSTLHKKIASARHDFIKLSGTENKLEALLQVLQPSLAKGNRVMVFCNTLNSSRAVDHFLGENQIYTVNYHGEVPAEERVENLKKFKSEDGDCPTLVCTDLAARGLDLDVDHVIMFDFPSNSIDYLHRTGRTARMGAKGKVTSLVAKRDVLLAGRIEDAIKKNESLESLTLDGVRRDISRPQINQQKVVKKKMSLVKASNQKNSVGKASAKPFTSRRKVVTVKTSGLQNATVKKAGITSSAPMKTKKTMKILESSKRIQSQNIRSGSTKSSVSKLNVVGFRGRSSLSSTKNESRIRSN